MKRKYFTEKYLHEYWSTGKPIIYKGKKYQVGKMSYGQYFFSLWKHRNRKETLPHHHTTKWLEKVLITNRYGVKQPVYKVI